ncbi:MAG: carboxypeptidase M32 [Bacteroidetes bacterium]|nr:carboxypeptidase M32 [Bacteroidota bacterium]
MCGWLTKKIYQYSAIYPPKALLKLVTGQELNANYLIRK